MTAVIRLHRAAGPTTLADASPVPAPGETSDALGAAVVEAWTSWNAREPSWTGTGTDLLSRPLPPDTACCGLWWD